MIEVKNLKKTYVTKGNVVTKALDDVSLKFPEKGLVFLLGKSGSGKSTLLNICGGLDRPDSGEIIIMGRSSSTFSGSDFDSYRNTFIGFIFQEYNILNEFNIEENLSLALELQGKKANKEKVKELLEAVDLVGFEKRKPNTMSGGQKQRVAIARALIKEPKIIMADEPTGALDSKTGKQVFDTLKKLSETHLVIVVSHDREFAEIYGDRIIELKDGQVLSDETKTHIEAKALNENISIIGDNTLSIKAGSKLSEKDKNDIFDFIAKANTNILISNSEHDIKSFKEANRISDDDRMESFKSTETENIESRSYTKDESKFIKSKMPMSKAARMGISSLKVKPIRLLLTMLLTIISFLMFGVSSSLMNYNEKTVINNSFNASDYTSINVNKEYEYKTTYYENGKERDSYTSSSRTIFTQNDIDKLYSTYGNNVLPIYSMDNSYGTTSPSNVSAKSDTLDTLKSSSIVGFSTAKEGSSYYTNMIAGNSPTQVFEVAIPEYYANLLLASDILDLDTSAAIKVDNMNDLIDKKIRFNIYNKTITFTICGIYKPFDMPSKYSGYQNADTVSSWSKSEIEDFNTYVSETLNKVLLIDSSTYTAIIKQTGYDPTQNTSSNYYKYFFQSKSLQISTSDYNQQYISGVNTINSENALPITYFDGCDSSSNGIVLSMEALSSLLSSIDSKTISYDETAHSTLIQRFDSVAQKLVDVELQYIKDNSDNYEYFEENFYPYAHGELLKNCYGYIYEDARYQEVLDEVNNDPDYIASYNKITTDDLWSSYSSYYNTINYSDKTIQAYNDLLSASSSIISKYNITYTLTNILNNNYIEDSYKEALLDSYKLYLNIIPEQIATIKIEEDGNTTNISRKIIGYYANTKESVNWGIYVQDSDLALIRSSNYSETTTNYKLENSDYYYNSCFIPLDKNNNIFNAIDVVGDDGTLLSVNNSLYTMVSTITSLVGALKKAFFYIGIVLAAFSALLLFNFITVSISNKTHEIGVLRAVGARGKDVFKIFFSESLFISLVAFIVALIGAIIVVVYMNGYISDKLTYPLHLLTFGPLSVIIMLSIAVAVAAVGTFIPVTIISRKKPVDSLRSL